MAVHKDGKWRGYLRVPGRGVGTVQLPFRGKERGREEGEREGDGRGEKKWGEGERTLGLLVQDGEEVGRNRSVLCALLPPPPALPPDQDRKGLPCCGEECSADRRVQGPSDAEMRTQNARVPKCYVHGGGEGGLQEDSKPLVCSRRSRTDGEESDETSVQKGQLLGEDPPRLDTGTAAGAHVRAGLRGNSAAGSVQAPTSGGSRNCSSSAGSGDLGLGTQSPTTGLLWFPARTFSERPPWAGADPGPVPCAEAHRSPILRKPICKPPLG